MNVTNRFGHRLYKTFFKTYTEKIWGIPCSQINADWASQRIKGLSLSAAVYNALFGVKKSKTLIDEFDYPIMGPGMMWQRFQEAVEGGGGKVLLNLEVIKLKHKAGRIINVTYSENSQKKEIPVGHVISSAPITSLVEMLDPQAPAEVLGFVRCLAYRAFIIVILIINKKDLFPDQWIYIHSTTAKVGRIQNFKNWSPAMVPNQEITSVGMEYFCTEGDEIWNLSDIELITLASQELSELGLADKKDIVDSCVLRQPRAYPVYDADYAKNLSAIRKYIEGFENLQTIGRNGMHRYNNMDHSMLTGILAAQNAAGADHDLWAVNEEEDYLEEEISRDKLKELMSEKALRQTFGRMDRLGFGTALGTVSGLLFMLATFWLMLKGVPPESPDLKMLIASINGYSISVKGAFIAFGYLFFCGFLFGWLFAYLRNLFIAIYLYRVKKKAELIAFREFFNKF